MSEQPHGPTQHHQPEKSGNPTVPTSTNPFMGKNGKWYIVGILAAVAVLVLIFVRKSNANSSSTTSGSGTTLDPTTEAMLQSALSSISSGTTSAASNNYGTGYHGGSWKNGNSGTSSTGTTTTSTGMNNAGAAPITINVPDGAGRFMAVSFPTIDAEKQFFTNEGVQVAPGVNTSPGENWPAGDTYQQILQAVQAVGGSQAGPTGQSGIGVFGYPQTGL